MLSDTQFPEYLQSVELLQQHMRSQLNGLSTTEKGARFARFVQRLTPQSEVGIAFEMPELSRKMASDGGVDLVARSKSDDRTLYIQSKLWVDRADTVDSVVSKFQAFTTSSNNDTPSLFDLDSPNTSFLLVTLSPLSRILESYKKQQYSSKAFYEQCAREGRIHFIDVAEILDLLRSTYSKVHQLPTKLTLNFETAYIKKDNVYIGVISSTELKSLRKQFGDALFFENVRDFLGIPENLEKMGRTTPNLEIIKTINHSPEKMLSRNNGLVFGAGKVERGKNDHQLVLSNGSVVNGCQTTTCLVDYADNSTCVLAKVVETEDAWDITKSANYQTSVPDIDLELARYLRPQLVKRAAANLGVRIKDGETSAFQLLDEIYDRKAAYSETRVLYIGLFSRTPNNVFASNYTELMHELIGDLYSNELSEEEIFDTLFLLQGISQASLNEAKAVFSHPSYANIFDRLYREDSLTYRCFLSILALCGATDTNISERENDVVLENGRVRAFLNRSRVLLRNEPEKFRKFHKLAVKIWMQDLLTDEDDIKVRHDMFVSSKRLNFTTMYRKLRMEADLDTSLQTAKA